MATMALMEELPNIPGLRRHPVIAKKKTQAFKFMHGKQTQNVERLSRPVHSNNNFEENECSALTLWSATAHIKETAGYNDLNARYSLRQQKADNADKTKNLLPFGAEPQRLPPFIKFDKKALQYHAWYKEPVPESPLETERVHKCDIYYYLENGTMQIVEHKQNNSALPQGDVLKRILIPKADGTGFYSDKDLMIGAEVNIFGKIFTIVDAKPSTKRHMAQKLNMEVAEPLPYPADSYTTYLSAKMQRETGADTTIPRNRQMHPMKEYMESILGKPAKMLDLGSFLAHDKEVLRFYTVWDDRDSLYGDLLRFKIHYYLVDDTMEIVPQHARNCGRDRIGKLLSRSKIMKETGARKGQNYHWRDLTVGSKVTVFGRELTILGADRFTKEFLAENGQPLGPEMVLPEEEYPKYARPIPPHTGYGSEEDTLKNCFSFDPKPPLKDGAKAIMNTGKILRYTARILTNSKDDAMRRFVIMYFMEDDTIAIREPPIRNSGFAGGNFLSRTKIMKNTEERYEPYDLFIGGLVQMVAHKFEIIDADDYTLNYMESHSHEGWPRSNIYKLFDKLRPFASQLRSIIVRLNHPTGRLSYQNVYDAVRATGVRLDKQEELTLSRALDPLRKGMIPSHRLIKKLEGAAH